MAMDFIFVKCKLQETLHRAGWWGDIELIKTFAMETTHTELIASNKAGYTALHLAIWNMHTDVVIFLLNAVSWKQLDGPRVWDYLQTTAYNADVQMLRLLFVKCDVSKSEVSNLHTLLGMPSSSRRSDRSRS